MPQSSNKQKLYYSNCLLQAIIVFIRHFPNTRMGVDGNSPSGISFYCDVDNKHRYRFRMKVRRNNRSRIKIGRFLILFVGYIQIETLPDKCNKYGLE